MKKILFVSVCLLAALVVSCASTGGGGGSAKSSGRSVDSRIPVEVRDAIKNAPEDALVGVGTAKMASLSQSRTISATRARADISRQMDTLVKDMIRDYTASSEIDHSAAISFQENITVALSQSRLQGSVIVDELEDAKGNYWTIVMLKKSSVVQEINQAAAAQKLRVPAMASFDAEARMNDAFSKAASKEITYVGE